MNQLVRLESTGVFFGAAQQTRMAGRGGLSAVDFRRRLRRRNSGVEVCSLTQTTFRGYGKWGRHRRDGGGGRGGRGRGRGRRP
jgi:hypothetical protein